MASICISSGVNGLTSSNYLLKEQGKNKSEEFMHQFKPDILELDVRVVKNAMEFRHQHIKRKMSMVDCIGYAVARKHSLLFLTGDDAFKNIEGVEFVK